MHIVPACEQTYTLYSRDGQVLAYPSAADAIGALDRAHRGRRELWIEEFVERFHTSSYRDREGTYHPVSVGTWRIEKPDGEPMRAEEARAIVREIYEARVAWIWGVRPGQCRGHHRDGAWPKTGKRGRRRYYRNPACHQALTWQDAHREDFAEIGVLSDKIGRRRSIVTAYDDIPRSRSSGRASWKTSRATQWRG